MVPQGCHDLVASVRVATIPLVLLIFACIGLYAVGANYFFERRIRRRMRHSRRYLSLADVRERIAAHGGALIIENPSLGWNFTHAWWTPDDLLSTSPFSVPTDEDYKNAAEKMKCLEWDKWCWDNYTCLDNGRVLTSRVERRVDGTRAQESVYGLGRCSHMDGACACPETTGESNRERGVTNG